MIQIGNLEELNISDINYIIEKMTPILNKRKNLRDKYNRFADSGILMYSDGNHKTKITFEKFITDLATGYLSGKPNYIVEDSIDEEKASLLETLLDKPKKDENYKKSIDILIEHISNYNDDSAETYKLIHDLLELTSCYEIMYENENNEIVYSNLDPLQTVAIWDYNTPSNLIGIVRKWTEQNSYHHDETFIELIDKKGIHKYKYTESSTSGEEIGFVEGNWGDVPGFAIETDFSIFEPIEDLIQAYEQLVQNVRNTFQYNDTDCKLKVSGYTPENPMTIIDKEGNPAVNPARMLEDNAMLGTKTFYVGEGGDIAWLSKPMETANVISILKTYIDLIFQMTGIPNTSDLAFNSADLNASAIDRKFYVMNMSTASIIEELEKGLLRRWELIFGRINLKKNTNFDFRDIKVEIPKNLPANNDERTDSLLKLNGIISTETLLTQLGYNYTSEKNKMDGESEDNMLKNIERLTAVSTQTETSEDATEKSSNNEKAGVDDIE